MQEESMHSILLFAGVLAAYIGIATASFAFGIWAISLDDPRAKSWASSWLSAMFWPLLPFFSRLGNKGSVAEGRRSALPPGTDTGAAESGHGDQYARRFRTIREAKDYLAGRIADEAKREGTPLTEVERKMLYFTETGWTLPDMKEVSAEFDRDYNQEEYERKIAGLVGRIQASDEAQSELEQGTWDRAVEKLSEGDHYLIVLICAVQPQGNPARHWLKVLAIALVLLALAALNSWFRQWLRDH
jgi:hypothetical protein